MSVTAIFNLRLLCTGVRVPHAGYADLCMASAAVAGAPGRPCHAILGHAGVHEHASGSHSGCPGLHRATAVVDLPICEAVED